jgi:hypothetical protein
MEMKLKLFIGSLVFFLVASACGFNVNLSSDSITGSGKRITETREVSGFDEVVLAGSGELYIEQGPKEALSVEVDDNVMKYVKTEVKGNSLVLGFKDNVSVSLGQPIIFRLTVRDITSVTLAGSGKVAAKALETDKLTINLPGSGEMAFDKVDTTTLHVTIAGSGNIKVAGGTADSEEINMLGSGDFDARSFQVKDASATIAGSGNIDVRASGKLTAKVLGSGNIRYYGSPATIDMDTAGSGNIQKMGE